MGWRSWQSLRWRQRVPSLVVVAARFSVRYAGRNRRFICQEVTEKAHPGGVALGQGEVPEWEGPVEEERAAREQVQVRKENALVLNAERLSLMKSACPVILGIAQNAGKRWSGIELPPATSWWILY
jgi:hypothetical protein